MADNGEIDPVSRFADYEAYLASQISEQDTAYLDSEEVARHLVELGYRGSGDTLKREEWESRKKADKEKHLHRDVAPKPLASMGKEKEMTGKPFLLALAAREELARNGKLTTIIFVRDHNSKGQEVSGYIDYASRLKSDGFEAIFEVRSRRALQAGSQTRAVDIGGQGAPCPTVLWSALTPPPSPPLPPRAGEGEAAAASHGPLLLQLGHAGASAAPPPCLPRPALTPPPPSRCRRATTAPTSRCSQRERWACSSRTSATAR